MPEMTPGQITEWIRRHDDRVHDRLAEQFVSREVYNRDLAELRADNAQLQATLTKAVWAIVSLVVAVLADLIATVGGRV